MSAVATPLLSSGHKKSGALQMSGLSRKTLGLNHDDGGEKKKTRKSVLDGCRHSSANQIHSRQLRNSNEAKNKFPQQRENDDQDNPLQIKSK